MTLELIEHFWVSASFLASTILFINAYLLINFFILYSDSSLLENIKSKITKTTSINKSKRKTIYFKSIIALFKKELIEHFKPIIIFIDLFFIKKDEEEENENNYQDVANNTNIHEIEFEFCFRSDLRPIIRN